MYYLKPYVIHDVFHHEKRHVVNIMYGQPPKDKKHHVLNIMFCSGKKKENKRVFGIFHNEKYDVLHEFIKTSCFTYGLGKNMMFILCNMTNLTKNIMFRTSCMASHLKTKNIMF